MTGGFKKREMLTSALRVLVKNLVKESFSLIGFLTSALRVFVNMTL